MTYTKTFTNKRQMISYYNKVANNPKIERCFYTFSAERGYMVMYSYRKTR